MLTLKYLETPEKYEIEAIQLLCYFMSRDYVWSILKALNDTDNLTTSELADKCGASIRGIAPYLKFLEYIRVIDRDSIFPYNKTYQYFINQQEAYRARENCIEEVPHLIMRCYLNSPEMRLDFIKNCTPHWLKGHIRDILQNIK